MITKSYGSIADQPDIMLGNLVSSSGSGDEARRRSGCLARQLGAVDLATESFSERTPRPYLPESFRLSAADSVLRGRIINR